MRLIVLAAIAGILSSAGAVEKPMFRLGVNVSYDDGTMRILSVDPEGPGARLGNATVPLARLEPNDVIEEVDGRPVAGSDDLVSILNNSLDGYVSLKIRDINTGQSSVWYTLARATATTPYEIMRDTCSRAIRTKQMAAPTLIFSGDKDGEVVVKSNLGSVLPQFIPDLGAFNGEEEWRRLLVGVLTIRQDTVSSPEVGVFSDETFHVCDAILSNAFDQIVQLPEEPLKQPIVESARTELLELLRTSIAAFSARIGKPYDRNEKSNYYYNWPSFSPRTSIPGGSVQILLFADKVIQLSRHGFITRPVDDAGRQFLETSITWTPLPAENAMAYGRYYYRLVYLEDGQLKTTPFDENRVIIIDLVPTTGEIYFQ